MRMTRIRHAVGRLTPPSLAECGIRTREGLRHAPWGPLAYRRRSRRHAFRPTRSGRPQPGLAAPWAGREPRALVADRRDRVSLAPDGLPPLREVIAAHGLSARKSLGQNFLMDLNLTAKIARRAGDLAACDVLEIGPGPGGLTRALLAEGARHVVAIERDARCLPALAEIAAAWPGRLTVLEGDALALDPLPHLTPPVRVVANLPYNVGTELLVRWLTPAGWPPFWTSLTLMFQKEVAERIVARPGSKAYGRLAILAQWRAEPRIAFEIPPRAFTPPPKVTSAVVQIDRLEAPRFPADAAGAVARRGARLRPAPQDAARQPEAARPDVEALLAAAGIAPTDRAEQVPLEALLPAQPARRRVANATRRLGRLDRALVGSPAPPAGRRPSAGAAGASAWPARAPCLRLRVGLGRLRRRMGRCR